MDTMEREAWSMNRVAAYLRSLSSDTLLKCTAAWCNIVATCFINLIEFYYSPHVLVLQSSPQYPVTLKWFARGLLFFFTSLTSVLIAWLGAMEDIRMAMTSKASQPAAYLSTDHDDTT